MREARINKLLTMAAEIIGPRIKDGLCVFCGQEIPKGGYCDCKKSEESNLKVKKIKKLLDRYDYMLSDEDFRDFVHRQITNAEFPALFASMDFSDYILETEEQKHNLQLTKDYVKNALKHYLEGTNLIFVGNFGNGKTMLMSIAGDEIIREYGIPIKYINIYDLSEKIKESFDDKNKSTSKIIQEYKKAPILILDDIDKVEPKPWVYELMYGFSNYRVEHRLPTWVNANHSIEELSTKYYGQGSISRLFQNSIKAKFTGENWRLRM